MKRRFNTTGPCKPELHYMVPAEQRIPEAAGLVEQMGYFVVHAPRQTGKTTALRALAARLTASGRYAAVVFSCEEGSVAGDNYGSAQRAVLRELTRAAEIHLPPELRPPPFSLVGDEGLVAAALTAWARACPRPLVLMFDEIDALRGQSLLSVLRQLRAGFPERPGAFPASVVLCGLRDVRDDKAARGGDPERLGTSSPFNIKLGLVAQDKPLRVANPIYGEVIVRVLAAAGEERIDASPERFRLRDGRLAFRRLLRAFAAFWREHGEVLASGMPYPEVAPQLVLMAFFQRIVNGGGSIDREYGVGRIDLLVRFPYRKGDGSRAVQRRAIQPGGARRRGTAWPPLGNTYALALHEEPGSPPRMSSTGSGHRYAGLLDIAIICARSCALATADP